MNPFIVVPYRDRKEHLPVLIRALRKLKVNYPVLIVEQEQGKPFNRAKLLNVGSVVSFQQGATHVITHDVDMIPTKFTKYELGDAVHLASAATQFGGKMPYDEYFGGVTVFSADAFQRTNGYSNEYWGWGAEDDDMLKRCQEADVKVTRVESNPFQSLSHEHALEQKEQKKLHAKNGKRFANWYDTSKDGINTLRFELVNQEELDKGVLNVTVSI